MNYKQSSTKVRRIGGSCNSFDELRPKGPRSAYNLFYRSQREVILKSLSCPSEYLSASNSTETLPKRVRAKRRHRKTHGKIGLQELTKLIAFRWRGANKETKDHYATLAKMDLIRYKNEMVSIRYKNELEEYKANELAKQKLNEVVTYNDIGQGKEKASVRNEDTLKNVRWREANKETREHYERLAETDLTRHKNEMDLTRYKNELEEYKANELAKQKLNEVVTYNGIGQVKEKASVRYEDTLKNVTLFENALINENNSYKEGPSGLGKRHSMESIVLEVTMPHSNSPKQYNNVADISMKQDLNKDQIMQLVPSEIASSLGYKSFLHNYVVNAPLKQRLPTNTAPENMLIMNYNHNPDLFTNFVLSNCHYTNAIPAEVTSSFGYQKPPLRQFNYFK